MEDEKMFKIVGNDISDGYHTFGELYQHRCILYIALCKALHERPGYDVWRTDTHSDGYVWDGWFILGIGLEEGEQITYHLPVEAWSKCSFAVTLDSAPGWDGHSPFEVLQRLEKLIDRLGEWKV